MIPQIDLSKWDKPTVPKEEVEAMTKALSEAFAHVLHEKEREYRFAKIISYLSLSIALILVVMEVFR